MKVENRADIRIALVGPADACRIRHHGFELLSNDRLSIGKIDRITVTFTHFASVGAHDFGKPCEMFLGFRKYRRIKIVESAAYFPCEFQMGKLILADRDEIGFV